MKRILTLAALGAALAVTACDRPEPTDEGLEPSPPVEVAPLPAETPPPVETAPAPTTPTDATALPEDQRSSEETVRPESETLFY